MLNEYKESRRQSTSTVGRCILHAWCKNELFYYVNERFFPKLYDWDSENN